MKDSNIYLIKSFGADSMRMVNKKANKQTPKLKTKQNIFIVSSMLRFWCRFCKYKQVQLSFYMTDFMLAYITFLNAKLYII